MAASPAPGAPPLRASSLQIERHRAERLGDIVVVGSVCCSSCCCCCCCVHSVGGVTGAAVGSAIAAQRSAGSEEAAGARFITVSYWTGFAAISLLVCVAAALADELWLGLGAVALAAPLLQLGVTILLLPLTAGLRSDRRAGATRALGAITAGALLGAIAGGILLLALGVVAGVISSL